MIADHLRASGFLVADGVLPANEGRGYVLRRIMRRAMRHAHLLGAKDPLMHRLVPALVAEMGAAYPELVRAQPLIEATLLQEETRFRQTLANGLRLLDEATGGWPTGDTLPGETAFKLYDTFGFPYDLTEDALRASGIGVDRAGFDTAMAEQKARRARRLEGLGRQGQRGELWFDIADELGSTEFIGYTRDRRRGPVSSRSSRTARASKRPGRATASPSSPTRRLSTARAGGQMGDAGMITRQGRRPVAVVRTPRSRSGGCTRITARSPAASLRVGDTVTLKRRCRAPRPHPRQPQRPRTCCTPRCATGWASMSPRRAAWSRPIACASTSRTLRRSPRRRSPTIEADVNAQIRHNEAVGTRLMTPDDAIAAGAMALFGEKYGDEVRVLSMGARRRTRIIRSSCAAAPMSRAPATSRCSRSSPKRGLLGRAPHRGADRRGGAAMAAPAATSGCARPPPTLKSSPDEVPARVAALVEERRRLERELADAKKALALGGGGGRGSGRPEQVGGINFVGQVLDGLDPKALRGAVDEAKARIGSGVVALVAVNEGPCAAGRGQRHRTTGSAGSERGRPGASARVEVLGGKGAAAAVPGHGAGRRTPGRRQGRRGARGRDRAALTEANGRRLVRSARGPSLRRNRRGSLRHRARRPF